MSLRFARSLLWSAALLFVVWAGAVFAADQPQWGERYTRNMVSSEHGLPAAFEPKTGDHILWSATLGGGSYSSPIIAQGKVFIGSNNSEPRDPRIERE